MQVFAGNYFKTKLRMRFLGIILMFLEYARLRLCLALSYIPHFFERERIVTVQKKSEFLTHDFPTKRETLHPIHVVCTANINSLNSLCEAIFSSSVF